MWLEVILITGVAIAALTWAALSVYLLRVQRRRDQARATLDVALSAIGRMHDRSLAERLAAVAPALSLASRDLVMRAAADRDIDEPVFETLATYLKDRWSIEALVRDGSAHVSPRERWRRLTALRILSRFDHPHTINLLARAVADRDAEVSANALALLGRSTDPRAIDLLVEALRSTRHQASRVAVYLDQSPQEIGPRLASLLDDDSAVVRQWAATLLARYPDQSVEPRLIELTDDPDARVRKAAIQTLGQIGGLDAGTAAIQLLSDDVPYVRAHAARALGQLGRNDEADRVATLLGDGDWWVRLAARESLEMMGPEVWPVLVRCLDHRDRFVRNGAAEVVQNLGVLDSLIMMEAATDNPGSAKIAMLRRIASAGGVRFTESLVERAGPVVGPRVRRLLDTMGLERVGAI
jgi:HEAT repeat protein